MPETTNKADVKQQIRDLANRHHVAYKIGPRDRLGHAITALAGDEVKLDETELLLLALERAGVISGKQATMMQAEYLRGLRHP